ncbi:outer membrane beta-barrel protein [Phocaeicola vulgatus]|jgi:hypothetical protein|uniref:outer membrane beta-barrel protein n=1 Tax=Phocaeicola vulgatus TaxID=821 RepID=UPI0015C02A18
MEKLLYIMLIWVVSTTSIYSQTVAGKIVDESNQPIEFANIVCLSLPDSTFIYGTISDQDGKFTIPENSSKGILRISSVGYATTYKECKDRNIGTILLHSDTQLLGEVVVKGNLPVTRMKGDALVTSVQNSVLAKAGSANDVLGKVPGILKDKDSFEVFGKGTPLIYINGREVRDKSELEQLSSEDIKHVELITNPGARYDATVNAVVRIQTIRRTGDGFGFNLNSSYYQSENVDLVEQADVNYRHNGLDMFAMFRYDKMEFRERTNVHQTLISKKQLDLENQLKYNDNKQWLRGNIGMNYMFDENNSIGIKYSIQGSPRYDSKLYTTSKVSLDGKVFDRLQNFTSSETDNELNHQLNAYYTGRVGNLEIDFNADYYQSGYLQEDITGEESEEQEDRDVHAASDVANNLAAAKLVLSYPVWKGKFSVGGEWTYTHRKDNYLNVENYVPSSNSKMNEMNITAFAEYSRSIYIGDFILGARYEQIKFDYYKDDLHIDDQSRSYDNIYPNVSFSTRIGKVKTQISYTVKTQRPSYRLLSNSSLYIDRFSIQQGNPTLKSEITHNLNWIASWKFLQLSLGYQQTKNAIIYWGEPLNPNEYTILLKSINLNKSLPMLNAFISASPHIGIWESRLSLGITKQWLTIDSDGQQLKLNEPRFTGVLSNSFTLPENFLLSLDMQFKSKGDLRNVYFDRFNSYVDISLRKSFLNDALSIEVRGDDLFRQQKSKTLLRSGAYSFSKDHRYDSREFSISLRYRFNTTKSKYKGTGAANDELRRL